ncbi:hypothetical protein N8T08_009229 [Aspergillus melleus]|uniref:Uncharacterized protein n=1 Tax=Aspergillus melleus TaxID=138277 RepID=A0ACC3ATZ7_9EURO|nr:hypothetical protein N8T08_009229 [Aspergillus melleus]
MKALLRNKQGCWTCRLRKKKCDEGRPYCSTCNSLSIPCYGYGPKPEWMDHGDQERAVANDLKQTVKRTSRRKVPVVFPRRSGAVAKIAPKPMNGSVESSSSSPISNGTHVVNPPSDNGFSQDEAAHVLLSALDSSPASQATQDKSIAESIFPSSATESVLLMHFLDNVFPLQHPMYKPGPFEGGRGWLLALLLRTKPLYHATLAVSSYHRRKMVFNIHHPCQVAGLVEQEKHLEICLKEFQQALKAASLSLQMLSPDKSKGLGIAASVVQLVFFELFTGQGNVWKVHLRAATNMVSAAHDHHFSCFEMEGKSRHILVDDLPLPEGEPVVTEQVASFRFLMGTILWLDIIASITAGTAPELLSCHATVIGPDAQIQLEGIMGCKNWAMLQIGRISALHAHKVQALQHGNAMCSEFEQMIDDIQREIQCSLAQGGLEGFSLSEGNSKMFNAILDPCTLVTHVFACMASIYLHLVTRDFQALDLLGPTISEAMRILQTQIPPNVLPSLVAPLYVIGSVARPEDEQFFRSVFSSPILLDPLLEHRGKVLPVLEEIWRRRKDPLGLTWASTLDLTNNLLLH